MRPGYYRFVDVISLNPNFLQARNEKLERRSIRASVLYGVPRAQQLTFAFVSHHTAGCAPRFVSNAPRSLGSISRGESASNPSLIQLHNCGDAFQVPATNFRIGLVLPRLRSVIHHERLDTTSFRLKALMRLALEPFDKLLYSLFDPRLRIIAEQPSSFAYVRISQRHIARLGRLMIYSYWPAKRLLEKFNQSSQLDGLRPGKVYHFKLTLIITHRGHHARDDVVNVSVIPSRRAITENRQRLACCY